MGLPAAAGKAALGLPGAVSDVVAHLRQIWRLGTPFDDGEPIDLAPSRLSDLVGDTVSETLYRLVPEGYLVTWDTSISMALVRCDEQDEHECSGVPEVVISVWLLVGTQDDHDHAQVLVSTSFPFVQASPGLVERTTEKLWQQALVGRLDMDVEAVNPKPPGATG